MNEPQPLNPMPIPEVPLARAPLVRMLAQVRFSPILAIRDPDKVAVFQEEIGETYPNLSRNFIQDIQVTGGQQAKVAQDFVWRFADQEKDTRWRVSLGVNFVSLETFSYDNRDDFLYRLRGVLSAVEKVFKPKSSGRLGLRYINRLTGEAVNRISELIRPQFLGIAQFSKDQDIVFESSIIHLMTDAQFLAQNGGRVHGRWGQLPAKVTYDPNTLDPLDETSWFLDLDMFRMQSQPFTSDELLITAEDFARCIYWLFREMVTKEFLIFYGGKP